MTDNGKLRVLVFGATGMLGSTIFRDFSKHADYQTFGTVRSASGRAHFVPELQDRLITDVHLDSEAGILKAFEHAKPHIVINCVGIIKQLPNASDHLESIAINASLPHRLAKYSSMVGARLIHFSTDCVFSGSEGGYQEDDAPDAYDLYGRTKLLGEVDYENAITLRTSIIGHEISRAKSLVDWFLSQEGEVGGFRKAIFSGLPTIEVSRVLRENIIPNRTLRGLYHLSVDPINKYDLLNLVAKAYGKEIEINPNDDLVIDRSLNSDRVRTATGFFPQPWPTLIDNMFAEYQANQGQQT